MDHIRRPPPIIVVDETVVQSLLLLGSVLPDPLTMVGGWAVAMRLRMARQLGRATEDLDVIVSPSSRPAAEALRAIQAIQDDDQHPCRLSGLPLMVDLLADSGQEAVRPLGESNVIEDDDGLRLLVPPMARLLTASAQDVILESLRSAEARVIVCLPSAGALFAAKLSNIALEFRSPAKRASDAQDALRLLAAFGGGGLIEDLRDAQPSERDTLRRVLEATQASGLVAQAGLSGYLADVQQVSASLAPLIAVLANPPVGA